MSNRWTLDGDGTIEIQRDEHGVAHVRAAHEADLYRGLGHCHAVDRGLAMLLMRILARGRASELIDASDEIVSTISNAGCSARSMALRTSPMRLAAPV